MHPGAPSPLCVPGGGVRSLLGALSAPPQPESPLCSEPSPLGFLLREIGSSLACSWGRGLVPDKIYFSPRELVSKGLISKSAGNRIRGGKGDFSPQTQPDLTAVSTLGLSPLHWAQATFMMQTFPESCWVQEAEGVPSGSPDSPSVKWSVWVAWETAELALGQVLGTLLCVSVWCGRVRVKQ